MQYTGFSRRFPKLPSEVEKVWKNTPLEVNQAVFSNIFPKTASLLEIYWKSSQKALLLALFSTRFPITVLFVEQIWKSAPKSVHHAVFSSRFPKTVLFMEQIWKSSQKHFPHIEKNPFVTLNHNGAPIFVLFFFRRNLQIMFCFSSASSSLPAAPDGTNIPWHSGYNCRRRRTSLSSYPVSCSR